MKVANPPVEHAPRLPGFKWAAAIKAGLISGTILLIVPQGIPWSGLSSFSPVVMGRPFTPFGLTAFFAVLLHMVLSIPYVLAVAAIVRPFRTWKGIAMGAVAGLGLYLCNIVLVAIIIPEVIGNEVYPIVAHLVFGLFSACLYKGMTREPVTASPENRTWNL